MATDLAAALGVSVDKLKPILEANRPEKPATRPAAGSKPDTTALVSAISDGLGIEKSTVQAALDKLRASHEADHTARRNAMSTALAKELGIDAATVKSALAELRPAGRR